MGDDLRMAGGGDGLEPLWQIDFPHSLGLLYSAFTYYSDSRSTPANTSSWGSLRTATPKYVDTILEHLMDLKDDGTFRLTWSSSSTARASR